MRGPSYLWEYERFTDETLCDCQSIFHCLVPKRASKNNVGNLTFLILGNGVFEERRMPQICKNCHKECETFPNFFVS